MWYYYCRVFGLFCKMNFLGFSCYHASLLLYLYIQILRNRDEHMNLNLRPEITECSISFCWLHSILGAFKLSSWQGSSLLKIIQSIFVCLALNIRQLVNSGWSIRRVISWKGDCFLPGLFNRPQCFKILFSHLNFVVCLISQILLWKKNLQISYFICLR